MGVGNQNKPKLEQNLSDRTKVLYSKHIENKVVKPTPVKSVKVGSSSEIHLCKGWAIKSKMEVKRLTKAQKDFLSEKFESGENRTKMWDPEDMYPL